MTLDEDNLTPTIANGQDTMLSYAVLVGRIHSIELIIINENVGLMKSISRGNRVFFEKVIAKFHRKCV